MNDSIKFLNHHAHKIQSLAFPNTVELSCFPAYLVYNRQNISYIVNCLLLGERASPTLGCSIKILRDIYSIYMSVCLSYAKMRRRNYVAQTRACSKSSFGLKPTCDTCVIHFDYTLEQL